MIIHLRYHQFRLPVAALSVEADFCQTGFVLLALGSRIAVATKYCPSSLSLPL